MLQSCQEFEMLCFREAVFLQEYYTPQPGIIIPGCNMRASMMLSY